MRQWSGREECLGKGKGKLTWLVERDVAVLADAAEEELDAAVGLDLLLIRLALPDEVLRVPVENVHLRWRDIDCTTRQQPAAHPMPGGGAP